MSAFEDEKRFEPRLPFPMRAVPITPGYKPWRIVDVSPGGAGMTGDLSPGKGEIIDVILTAPFLERPGAAIDVAASVEVVRQLTDENGGIEGIGIAWISIVSRGPVSTFRDFVRGILCIPSGYFRKLPGEDMWEYIFPRAAKPVTGTGIPPTVSTGAEQVKQPGVFKVTFPTVFETDKEKGGGFAIKVMTHAMRIATRNQPPAPYSRIRIALKIGEQVLELSGTVGNVKKATDGQESRFDVQLSLGNNPGDLATYRRHIEELAASSDRAG